MATSVGTAGAQTLTQSDLVQGQVARLQVDGAASGDLVAFLISYAGVGSGPCFPSAGICLDLLSPFSIVAVLPAGSQGDAAIQGIVPSSAPLIPVFSQAAVIAPSGAVVKTNAISASFLPLSHLGDEFDGAALDPSWTVLHPEVVQLSVGGGSLRMQPLQAGPSVTWFNDGQGPLVYKNVTGDFTVTAVARAYDPGSPTAPPPANYRLAGILVRDPSSTVGNHNFVHVAVGGGDGVSPVAVEDKTTTASGSDFLLYPIAATVGELRITRAATLLSLYYRPDSSSPWQLLRAHQHPEFPATLQVGLMVYSFSSPPSIAVEFERIEFSP